MERSFAKEVGQLRLGENEVFQGEGILAMTKALLQSGVSYVGGYQGAPVSHMIDVLNDAHEILDELGVHFETSVSEAAAAAMLGASINYPLRGAVVWKSVVGTNVASDALSNIASAGVQGGALILVGEDYGEGSSIIQERSHAFAMKSSIWLFDPRPQHQHFVELIERAFEMSEATNSPVMMEFRIRTCHVFGSFVCKDNRPGHYSRNNPLTQPQFDYGRITLPPSVYEQEKHKIDVRLPRAIEFIREHGLNEVFPGTCDDVGIILQGGLYNSVVRAMTELGLADDFGNSSIPMLALNVTYPLVPEEIAGFCKNKKAVLVIEEGHPDYLQQAVESNLRRHDIPTAVHGKDVLPMAGEYVAEVLMEGLHRFLHQTLPTGINTVLADAAVKQVREIKKQARELLEEPMPKRPPGFCVGCPERPVFSALKIVQEEVGPVHISSDCGCNTFSTLPPFNMGSQVVGYGMSLASSAALGDNFRQRVVSVMGDGGFWHNGLLSGVSGAMFNKTDSAFILFDNGYSSATGQQALPSSPAKSGSRYGNIRIVDALKSLGVRWVSRVDNYRVGEVIKTLRNALGSPENGLKVILAEGECQLARQRRIRPLTRKRLDAGQRVIQSRFGVDPDMCTGDHSCIRLSGCPSLTIKPNPSPLRLDPVATVDSNCVGCGLCGEIADAVALCPSFYRVDAIRNASLPEKILYRLRAAVIGLLRGTTAERLA